MVVLALVMMAAVAPAPGEAAPASAMQQLVQNCDAHKFETIIDVSVDGKPKQSKVKLCGTEGQSDADWLKTLKDAVLKTEANRQMPAGARKQIVTALNGEIARLGGSPATALLDIKTLPAPSLPPARNLAPRTTAQPEYTQLPDLPTAPPAPVRVLGAAAVGVAIPTLPRPQMSFSCYTPGDVGTDGPCFGFARETMLTVRADEDLPSGTALRFVRDGDPRADVEVSPLKRGRTMRMVMPAAVCSHAVGGKLELRIVRAGQEVGTEGPYNLRC